MTPKVAFQVSQFSGPLAYGPFPMVSSLPPMRITGPSVRPSHGTPLTNVPNPASPVPRVKTAAEVAEDKCACVEEYQDRLESLIAAKKTLKKIAAQGYGTTITHVSSPAAVLRRTQAVGQGKITPPPGPSIASQVRPVNVGKGSPIGPVLPGAGKSILGV